MSLSGHSARLRRYVLTKLSISCKRFTAYLGISMLDLERLQIFQAQTKNVQVLDQARRQVNRAKNRALRKSDISSSQVYTKVSALRLLMSMLWHRVRFRNKVAHGQWIVALNRENTAVNTKMTTELGELDTVVIWIWYRVHQHLSSIVEALIESPDRAFHRDYWQEIA